MKTCPVIEPVNWDCNNPVVRTDLGLETFPDFSHVLNVSLDGRIVAVDTLLHLRNGN